MENNKRTKEEMIEYFKHLAYEFEKQALETNDPKHWGKAEAYELAAFNLERNMK